MEPSTLQADSGSSTARPDPAPGGQEHGRRKYTPRDWQDRRAEISRLYKDGKLKDVMARMRQRYGLDATRKQYLKRLSDWGLNKNMQTSEAQFMIEKQARRADRGNKKTAFILRGTPVDQKKIDRYKRNHPLKPTTAEDVEMEGLSLAVTPEDITYYTPDSSGSRSPEIGTFGPPSRSQTNELDFNGEQSSQGGTDDDEPDENLHNSSRASRVAPPDFANEAGHSGPEIPTAESNAYLGSNYPNIPPLPPNELIGFGSGAPRGYLYQYSNCTGRKKALLIGINYFGQRGQLHGCINDVRNLSAFLIDSFGYQRANMVILTDDQQNPLSQPTKQNILRAMHWLVKDARVNDALFFHYSGHGGQTKDLDGDEDDGYDEVIYPVDFRTVGHIVDDEMHAIMVRPLKPGVRLTALFDSCHSGFALDLPYIYSTQGILREPNLAKEAGSGLLGTISNYASGNLGGVASGIMDFFKKATTGDDAHNGILATKTSPADVVMWSGGSADQTSSGATIAAQATGAMSSAFIAAMKKNPDQSYVQLLVSIRDELATKYSQKPQLSCSHPLDTNLLFVM